MGMPGLDCNCFFTEQARLALQCLAHHELESWSDSVMFSSLHDGNGVAYELVCTAHCTSLVPVTDQQQTVEGVHSQKEVQQTHFADPCQIHEGDACCVQ